MNTLFLKKGQVPRRDKNLLFLFDGYFLDCGSAKIVGIVHTLHYCRKPGEGPAIRKRSDTWNQVRRGNRKTCCFGSYLTLPIFFFILKEFNPQVPTNVMSLCCAEDSLHVPQFRFDHLRSVKIWPVLKNVRVIY